MNHEIIKALTPKEYIMAFLDKDLRIDQRDLKERRNLVYKYNVLDLISPSASGNIGKNRVLLVLKYKENTKKSLNNLNFIIDFSSETNLLSDEKLKTFLEKLSKNNVSFSDRYELCIHIKVLNFDGNLTDCIANSLLNFFEDISHDKNMKDQLNLHFINKYSSHTFCVIEEKLVADPSKEEIEISTVYFSIIKFTGGSKLHIESDFIFFKLSGGIIHREYLKLIANY